MERLPGYDAHITYGGESEPTPDVVDCEECGGPADAESVPLRGRYLCHGCGAALALSVLESVTEGRIARIDAIQRLREFANYHERLLRLDIGAGPVAKRVASDVKAQAFATMQAQAEMAKGGK
jgi:hypothetical protein